MKIPFNIPHYTGKELDYIKAVMETGKICGDGIYTSKINEFIEEKFGAKKALFVTSGSSALDMAALLIGLKPGDEVIMPSYTFVSTANSVVLRGARVIFADIDPRTMNIDPEDIERRITRKTRAIFPVHYAGVSCDMDRIMELADKYGLRVVEDAAQGVNAKYKGKYLGTIGDIGCYSFHETKNYVCGEGGAILINRDDALIERAEIIREKGTNRRKFLLGQVDKYSWVDIGSSYLGSDILAGFLYAQLESMEEINNMRRQRYEFYFKALEDLMRRGFIGLPFVPDGCDMNFHMFYIVLKSEEERNRIMNRLKKNEINAVFHYIPLHLSSMGERMGYKKGDLPITEEYSGRLLRLPL
ncbi:MAG: lipopolysaccharide biosynthesis protein RffA, partial [Clostridiales bacterium]|nr:lipopolysaccharide biosynthesis protein RffA [Clostridiales bacterium]